ncbi:histidine kinase [Methanolacinia petrolearia DSM 11571]|uniref:histidine kinase n=1 Tax=Methanolacinia petrolearia (strain DSM 11571 / OCM 486 / SEBR 4847) TaxID=679926 RepID=E1RDL3_METP4|nr:ATP-binding protein [Methanolacinia petrolearia]ADN35966.1 histidine kinase [Methanolacinia petrolearia DSM 11571]
MITNINEREEELALYDSLPVGICVINPEFQVLFWNRCLENWSGIKKDRIKGTDLRDKCEKLNNKHFQKRFELIFNGGPPDSFSSQLHKYLIPSKLHNGNMRIQHTTVVASKTDSPGKYNAIIICEDVSNLINEVQAFRHMKDTAIMELNERIKAENTLKIVNNKLNLMNSITRHDILNQLTVAIMSLNLLGIEDLIPADSKEYKSFKRIESALENIKQQINFTKDYQDMGVESPGWYDIGRIVERTGRAAFRDLAVTNELTGYEIYADPLFEKVIYTLFDNAVRHGKKVTGIYFSASEDNEGNLNIICKDNGIGIPEAEKEKIFDRGYGKNTGLGLFLSREILSITGISITEDGVYGEGARFLITVQKEMYRTAESL